MSTLVIYYSYTGKTKEIMEKRAAEMGAESFELLDHKKKPGKLKAFMKGCPAAMKRKPAELKLISVNLDRFDKIVIGCPVWAGHPAPAFNNVVLSLPKGKEVEIVLTSGGGNTKKSKDATIAFVEKEECKVTNYEDVKTAK